jgi:hypothetical protein
LPGEKKRSLIFGEVFSIAASRAGVEKGAATAAAAPVAAVLARPRVEGATFGTLFAVEDIGAVLPLGKNQG